MKYPILTLFLFFISINFVAQVPAGISRTKRELPVQRDSLQKPPITAYKIISVVGDTTYVDTSLTIQKEYKFNYLRNDNFELLPFPNIGQTYNKLGYSFEDIELLPEFGAQARHFAFLEAEDIYYYEVPTPLTELYFRTVAEQGQTLDAFFTVNTSPRLNFSVAYKGHRSLGNYQNMLTSTGSFRSTLNYSTLNARYRLKSHFVSQDLLNRESGGLNDIALQQYLDKEEEFEDRSLLEVKFENAENVLFGKRFYLNQEYDLVKNESNQITLHHLLNFSDKKYIFRQTAPDPFFGESLRNTALEDEVKLRLIKNVAGLSFTNSILGKIAAKAGHTYYNYGYNSVIFLEEQVVPNRIRGENYSAGAEYSKTIGTFSVYADAMINVEGEFSGNVFSGGVGYKLNDSNVFRFEVSSNERAPNFNFLLHQSDYLNYNWFNNFRNQVTQVVDFNWNSLNIVDVKASYTQIENYAFFSVDEENAVKPFQYDGNVNYFKLMAQKEFTYGKFSLNNTVMYQKVLEGGEVLNVPEFVTRNSFYFTDQWFQKALFLQTGFTLKFFTSYEMNGYDPLLAEFYVQNSSEFGGYPAVDFFFNSKIRTARIFFKLENLNFLLTGNNNFSAPDYPHRDFLIRFGLVWNFFM